MIRGALIMVFITLTIPFAYAPIASAQNIFDPACNPNATDSQGNKSSLCSSGNQSVSNNSLFGPDGIVTKIIGLFSAVIGIAGVIAVIIGGFKYVISSGDSSNINSAKDTILYALIGLAIAGVAQLVVRFVLYNIK